ncbi:MAG: DUF3224 domain-containing protein [Chloroflexi bacterium]|nr:DUF3224 domain-containing protein [Chloroflexota bacterium]OJV89257.1 MAG: hypothetical protein BGO39_35265 [Chloroflexi bacterium 54-19]
MTRHAESTFSVVKWDENTYEERPDSKKLNLATVLYTYTGDMVGESRGDSLLVYPTERTSNYVGLERITATLGGKSGSFVLLGTGYFDGKTARSDLTIVPGSGTGDLTGLKGTGQMVAAEGTTGTLTLDYDFE